MHIFQPCVCSRAPGLPCLVSNFPSRSQLEDFLLPHFFDSRLSSFQRGGGHSGSSFFPYSPPFSIHLFRLSIALVSSHISAIHSFLFLPTGHSLPPTPSDLCASNCHPLPLWRRKALLFYVSPPPPPPLQPLFGFLHPIQTCVVEMTARNLKHESSNNMLLQTFTKRLKTKQLKAPSSWLSHPELGWLMWKVCAEPTTSAAVGLWNSNSHEERPTLLVTPNPPAAAAHSLFLIPLFHSIHHLRVLRIQAAQQETRWPART